MTGGHRKLRLIGDRSFYMHVAAVAVPIIVQNTLTNIISLLDNIMVGQVGTIPMSAVAVVNQLILIFYLCVWGGLAGAGIFGAQFFGSGDMEGLRQTTRFKMVMMVVFTLAAWGIFLAFGDRLIGRIEPKADRETGTLTIRNIWLEQGVRRTKKLSNLVDRAAQRLAKANGCTWTPAE